MSAGRDQGERRAPNDPPHDRESSIDRADSVSRWAHLSEREPLTAAQKEGLRAVAIDNARARLKEFHPDLPSDELFSALPRAAMAAFHLERFEQARVMAEGSLDLARDRLGHWNHGNAIHLGHTVLGLLALTEGKEELAIEELKKSGETPGSPQLMSFGPTMQLANELLHRGRAEPVLEFFAVCRRFWWLGETHLDIWENKVKAGEMPNFFHHLFG